MKEEPEEEGLRSSGSPLTAVVSQQQRLHSPIQLYDAMRAVSANI